MVMSEKEAFAKRLHHALDLIGAPQKGKGRQAATKNIVNNNGGQITENAARKWLEGESIPGMENLLRLAKGTNTNLEWLGTGRGPMSFSYLMTPSSISDAISNDYNYRIQALPSGLRTAVIAVLEAQETYCKNSF